MKGAAHYQNNNSIQRRDAAEVLEGYGSRIRWKRNDARVLDVGCGDGGVMAHVLRPRLPENFARLTGCDIAPEMIKHAELYHKQERMDFRVMDIAAGVPEDMVGQYDHVFSFYALHWVQQQDKALANIASLLAPGGDCLLALPGNVPIFDVYRAMAARPTWAPHMRDLPKFISPYHDCAQPHRTFRRLLRAAGFRRAHVRSERKVFVYEGLDALKKAVRAVNPFNHRLTPAQREQFQDDYVDVLREMGLLETADETGAVTVRCAYTLIVAHATK